MSFDTDEERMEFIKCSNNVPDNPLDPFVLVTNEDSVILLSSSVWLVVVVRFCS